MVALIFFQMTAVIVILGAELNRGIFELKRLGAVGLDNGAVPAQARG
jgi:membrane protein